MPEAVEGNLAGDGDGGGVEQFVDARADEGDAKQVAMVEVDHHPGPAPVAIGVQVRPDDRLTEIDIDRPDTVPGPLGLLGGQADRGGLRVAEEDLRHRVGVGSGGMGAPGRGVQWPPGGAGGDRVAGDARLVLDLGG